MSIQQQALEYAKEKVKLNPSLREDIYSSLQLMIDEIEEGGSEQGEYNNFISDVDDLCSEHQ